jgi:hypothetical protein
MTPPTAEDIRVAWRRFQAVVEEIEAFFAHHGGFIILDQKLINEKTHGTRN